MTERATVAELRAEVDAARERWIISREMAELDHAYLVRMRIALELAERREAEGGSGT